MCWHTHTHTSNHTDLLAAFRSDNISQTTSHVAMKAPIKSAWCCKSLVWFGACKPLESQWPGRPKCTVGACRYRWGDMVRLSISCIACHLDGFLTDSSPITRARFWCPCKLIFFHFLPVEEKKSAASIDFNSVPPVENSSSCFEPADFSLLNEDVQQLRYHWWGENEVWLYVLTHRWCNSPCLWGTPDPTGWGWTPGTWMWTLHPGWVCHSSAGVCPFYRCCSSPTDFGKPGRLGRTPPSSQKNHLLVDTQCPSCLQSEDTAPNPDLD